MLELTPIQQATLVAERLSGHTFYTGVAADISPDQLDLGLVQTAVASVLDRHDALGLTLTRAPDGSVRQVPRAGKERMTIEEVAAGDNVGDAFHQVLDEPWDLFGGPVARLLLTRGQTGWSGILAIHHLFADAVSMEILSGEIAQTCLEMQYGTIGPPLPRAASFVQAAQHQVSRVRTARTRRGIEFWTRLIGDAPHHVELFAPPPRRRRPSYNSLSLPIPLRAAQALAGWSRSLDVSPEALTLAIVGEVLAHHGAGQDMLVAAPATTRLRRYGHPLVGMFANTVVRRVQLAGDLPSTARALAAQALSARAWSDVPFAKVIEAVGPPRQAYTPPLAQIGFHYGTESDRADRLRAAGYESRVQFRPLSPFAGGFDLSVCFEGHETRPELVLRFDDGRIEADQAVMLGQAIIERVGQAGAPTRQSRPALGAPDCSPEPTATAVSTIELCPDTDDTRPALIDFDGRAFPRSGLARLIGETRQAIRQAGLPAGSLVGLDAGLNVGSVVSALACLAEGHPFVALDRSSSDRDRRLASLLAPAAYLTVAAEGDAPALTPAAEGDARPYEVGTAMLIATSGSTGEPKVIALSVANIESFLGWASGYFHPTELQRVLATTSPRFDCFLFEILLPVWVGATIVMGRSLPSARLQTPMFDDVTYVATTPTVLRAFLDGARLPSGLLGLTLAGEPCPADLVDRIFTGSNVARVRNLYGPSEVTTYAVGHTIERADWGGLATELKAAGVPTVPIGQSLVPHANAWLATSDGLLCAPGVPGELWLDGPGVALGYVEGAPTAPAFVTAENGARLYRTGDRCAPAGSRGLRFLGRVDRQLKIRGVRIEPAEIEQALRATPGVVDALVRAGSSERSLAATLAVDHTFTGFETLRSELGRRLPSYLMPTEFSLVDQLPTTGFGKAVAVDAERVQEAHGPTSYLEEALHEIFAHVLSRHHLSRFADFFELGGDSLDMIKALVLIEERLGTRLEIEQFVNSASVNQLALVIAEAGPDERYRPVVVLRTGQEATVVCLVHGGPGDLKFAYPLVRAMTTTATVCGVRAEGLASGGLIRQSVEEMASTYTAELLEANPGARRVHLVGYCSGGLIALEMAAKLQQVAVEVPTVVLLHSPLPSGEGTGCVTITPGRNADEEFEALVKERSLQLELQMMAIGQQEILRRGESSDQIPYFHKRTQVMAAIDLASARATPRLPASSALVLVVAAGEATADRVTEAWQSWIGPRLRMSVLDANTVTMTATPELAELMDRIIDDGDLPTG